MSLSEDVTITDIIGSLEKPMPYLRGVFDNMYAWKKANGTAYVSIGTTGDGRRPHYRVGPSLDSIGTISEGASRDEILAFMLKYSEHCRAFHGSNHKRLEWGVLEIKTEHWSTREMSYDDVRDLIAKVRTQEHR